MLALETKSSIVGFNNKSVNSYYGTFLEGLKINSIDTHDNYKLWIQDFFMYLCNKDLPAITWEEVKNIEFNDIKRYINHLRDKGNVNSTINYKLKGVKSLFDYLSTVKEHKDIDTKIFKHRLPMETNSYGSFSYDEYINLLDFTKNSGKSRNPLMNKGEEKALCFEVLYITALRISAVLNLSWSKSFQKLPDINTGGMVWTIRQRDKRGKIDTIAISDEFYNKLLTIKKEGQDNVFNLTEQILQKSINDFCKHYEIDKEQRRLVIHSLKSTSGEVARIRSNNNMTRIQKHLHHANPATTLKHYSYKNQSLKDQISYTMDKQVDTSELNNYTKEELIKAIKKSDTSLALTILENLKNI